MPCHAVTVSQLGDIPPRRESEHIPNPGGGRIGVAVHATANAFQARDTSVSNIESNGTRSLAEWTLVARTQRRKNIGTGVAPQGARKLMRARPRAPRLRIALKFKGMRL